MIKQLPNDINAEAAILSAMMIDSTAIIKVEEILSEDSFYRKAHQIIFNNILQLYKKNITVDILTLIDQLKKNNQLKNVGGEPFINELADVVLSSSNLDHHTSIVVEKSELRKLIKLGNNIMENAYADNADAKEITLETKKCVSNIGDFKNGFKPFSDTTKDTIKLIGEIHEPGGINKLWVRSGIHWFDNKFFGFMKKALYIIAARPAMGKTALAINMMQSMAYNGLTCALSELEMDDYQLQIRMISAGTGIPISRIIHGECNQAELSKIAGFTEVLADMRIYTDETAGHNIDSIINSYQSLKLKHGKPDIWFVDYLQLMQTTKAENRNLGIGDISRGLKIIAKEENIPVIALCQLNRSCELKHDKLPRLADLRESGNIEQDADSVIFLMRPCVYNEFTNKQYEYNGKEYFVDDSLAFIYSQKDRHGSIVKAVCSFNAEKTRFEERI